MSIRSKIERRLRVGRLLQPELTEQENRDIVARITWENRHERDLEEIRDFRDAEYREELKYERWQDGY